MYYQVMLPASSLKELSLRCLYFRKPHDPSATGSLFVTMVDSSTTNVDQGLQVYIGDRVKFRCIFGVDTHKYTQVH